MMRSGKSLKRGRQAVLFTTVNPMEDENGMGETPCDLTKPRILPYKKTWKVQFGACARGRSAILPNAVTCSRSLQHTACSLHVCMKTQEEFYQKVRLTPRVPRVVRESNSQCGLQDPQNQDARSSWETIKRFEKLRGNLQQHRGSQNTWSTS